MFLPSSFTAKNRRKINLELVIFQKKFSKAPARPQWLIFKAYRLKILDLIKEMTSSPV